MRKKDDFSFISCPTGRFLRQDDKKNDKGAFILNFSSYVYMFKKKISVVLTSG
jgi:hypothetical protein